MIEKSKKRLAEDSSVKPRTEPVQTGVRGAGLLLRGGEATKRMDFLESGEEVITPAKKDKKREETAQPQGLENMGKRKKTGSIEGR